MNLEQARAKGIAILDKPPAGWIKINGGTTEPCGYHWWFNGKSRFGGNYKNVLVKEVEHDTGNFDFGMRDNCIDDLESRG